jgi:hypothetical protein
LAIPKAALPLTDGGRLPDLMRQTGREGQGCRGGRQAKRLGLMLAGGGGAAATWQERDSFMAWLLSGGPLSTKSSTVVARPGHYLEVSFPGADRHGLS